MKDQQSEKSPNIDEEQGNCNEPEPMPPLNLKVPNKVNRVMQEEESDSDDDQTHVVASMVDTEKLKTTTVERNASHEHGAERTQMEVDDTLHSQ